MTLDASTILTGSWMSLSEAAEYLGVSKKTIQRSAIPRSYIGRLPRFRRDDIDQFLTERAVVPRQDDLDLRAEGSVALAVAAVRRPGNRQESKGDRVNSLLKLMIA